MRFSNNKSRAEKILESDRIGLKSEAEELVKKDIESLLCEYFCLEKRPKVILGSDGEQITITVEATAKAVKKFNLLK